MLGRSCLLLAITCPLPHQSPPACFILSLTASCLKQFMNWLPVSRFTQHKADKPQPSLPKSFINFPSNSVTSQNLVQTSECDIYVWRPLSNRTVIFLMLDVLLVHHTVRDTCGLLTLPVTIPRNEREIHHPASLRVSFLRARSRVQGPVPNNIP